VELQPSIPPAQRTQFQSQERSGGSEHHELLFQTNTVAIVPSSDFPRNALAIRTSGIYDQERLLSGGWVDGWKSRCSLCSLFKRSKDLVIIAETTTKRKYLGQEIGSHTS